MERVLGEVLEVAKRKEYCGGRLWRGMRIEDAAREVFLQRLFGMKDGYDLHPRLSVNSDTSRDPAGPSYRNVGLMNVRAPACTVRYNWVSDADVVGLEVGFGGGPPRTKVAEVRV